MKANLQTSKRLLAAAAQADNSLAHELASHCAILTLELEQALESVEVARADASRLRQELTQQRTAAKVLAFPVGKRR